MSRFDFLPSYHYEDNTDGIINNPTELALRDYTIDGNCGKNLIPYPYANTTKTEKGITFTDNGDGTITASGTTSAISTFQLIMLTGIDTTKKYVLSGSCENFTVYASLYQGNTLKKSITSQNGNAAIIDFPSYTDLECDKILLRAYVPHAEGGTTVENVTIKPQLEVGETATEYEQYKSVGDLNSTDNKYHIPIVCGGKNIFDADQFLKAEGWKKSTDGVYSGQVSKLWTKFGSGTAGIDIPLRGKKLAISFEARNDKLTTVTTYFQVYSIYGSKQNIGAITSTSWTKYSGITNFDDISKIVMGYNTNDIVYLRNLQIAESDEPVDYEAYITPRTTNIILDSPLGPGESISKKADNLPEITLNKGSNIITVDTEVKPKATTYQYYTY